MEVDGSKGNMADSPTNSQQTGFHLHPCYSNTHTYMKFSVCFLRAFEIEGMHNACMCL